MPCRLLDHQWRAVRTHDGAHREICQLCGTVFPCRTTGCGHVDCHLVRGEPLPEGVTADPTCTCPPDEILLPHRDGCPAGAS